MRPLIRTVQVWSIAGSPHQDSDPQSRLSLTNRLTVSPSPPRFATLLHDPSVRSSDELIQSMARLRKFHYSGSEPLPLGPEHLILLSARFASVEAGQQLGDPAAAQPGRVQGLKELHPLDCAIRVLALPSRASGALKQLLLLVVSQCPNTDTCLSS